MRNQISTTVSPKTKAQFNELLRIYNTGSTVLAIAIDRLYQAEIKPTLTPDFLTPTETKVKMKCLYCNEKVTQSQLSHAEAIKTGRAEYVHTDCIDDFSRQPEDAYYRETK